MSIINVNAFESRVSNKNYLTNYTDPYLKQSLANLGQRLASKGDSIANGSFYIKDLFSNYLGKFNSENLICEFDYDPSSSEIIGNLMELQTDGSRIQVGSTNSTSNTIANTSITISNVNNLLKNISEDDYPSDFYINDSDGVNNSAYWHRSSAVISKFFDDEIGEYATLFKIVGHNTSGKYGPYDNEYICDEISDSGKFVSGFRIFMTNEENLMLATNGEVSQDGFDRDENGNPVQHENLAMLYLHKNSNYQENTDQSKWILSVYQCNTTDIELGEMTSTTDDDIVSKIQGTFDSDDTNTPSQIVDNLINTFLEPNYFVGNNISSLFSHKYDIYVDEDTSDNVSFSIRKNQNIPTDFDKTSLTNRGRSTKGEWDKDDSDDKELLELKLEYFTNDISEIYPMIQEVYNQIMYSDNDNLKLKKQIVSSLIRSLYESYISENEILSSDFVYKAFTPVDLEIKYTYNSNNSSLIYTSSSSVVTKFADILDKGDNTYNLLKVIANQKDEYNNSITNQSTIIALGNTAKSVMYDFNINYLDGDIVSNIAWYKSFVMPYISENGFWYVNDVATDVYAKGSAEGNSGLIILQSNNPNKFDADEDIIFANGKQLMTSWGFTKRNFKTQYNLGNDYTLQAYLPDDETLNNIANTNEFAYIKNSLVMVMSSTYMEKDAFQQSKVYESYSVSDVQNEYNSLSKTYPSAYEIWLGSGNYQSYIYKMVPKANSLTSQLGSEGLVTSFWQCVKSTDVQTMSSQWTMTYLKKSDGTALDLVYMGGLDKYIETFISESVSNPDNYLHRWVIFDGINTKLKNNTIDDNSSDVFYPVLRNYDATYFSKVGLDASRSLGSSESVDEQQYKNNLNFSVEFADTISRNSSRINGVFTTGQKMFEIGNISKSNTSAIAYTKSSVNGLQVGLKENVTTKRYGYIPYVIPYTYFPSEYLPNTIYNNNTDTKVNKYPGMDFKEVLLRNVNTLNRYNILALENHNFDGVSKGVLYNAYIGAAYDQEDKSHLTIGSSRVNPNLGMTTMVNYDSATNLTPIEHIDIDFSYINLNGDVDVTGNLRTNKTQWKATFIPSVGGYAYSTITIPTGELYELNKLNSNDKAKNAFDSDYNPQLSAYSSFSSNLLNKVNIKYPQVSKYYPTQTPIRPVSYLNVTKLLLDNGVAVDGNSKFYGDKRILTKWREDQQETLNYRYNKLLLEIYDDNQGVFTDMFLAYHKDINGDYSNEIWFKYLQDYFELSEAPIKDIYNLAIKEGKVKFSSELTRLISYRIPDDSKTACLSYAFNTAEDPKTIIWKSTPDYVNENNDELQLNKVYQKELPILDSFILEAYKSGWFLELSTDLTGQLTDENLQVNNNHIANQDGLDVGNGVVNPIVTANPIEISYLDTYSYSASIALKSNKMVLAYMYVDGDLGFEPSSDISDLKRQYNDYYRIQKDTTSGEYIWDKKYAYNEAWNCSGCSYCSQYTCDFIGICKHSSLKGSFHISYGWTYVDGNDEIITYSQKIDAINKHVYRHPHIRYYENENGQKREYISYSYYPASQTITYESKGCSQDEWLRMISTWVDDTQYVLDYKGELVHYDANKTKIASSYKVGTNILCSYWADASLTYSENAMGMSYELIPDEKDKGTVKTVYTDGDGVSHERDRVQYQETYILAYQNYVSIGEKPYDYVKSIPQSYQNSHFSYVDEIETGVEKIYLTYRNVNVRELVTGNSTPDYFNGSFVNVSTPEEYDNDTNGDVTPDTPETVHEPKTKGSIIYYTLSTEVDSRELYNVDWTNYDGNDNKGKFEYDNTPIVVHYNKTKRDKWYVWDEERKEYVYSEKDTLSYAETPFQSIPEPTVNFGTGYPDGLNYTSTVDPTNRTLTIQLDLSKMEDGQSIDGILQKNVKSNLNTTITISNNGMVEEKINVTGKYTPYSKTEYVLYAETLTADGSQHLEDNTNEYELKFDSTNDIIHTLDVYSFTYTITNGVANKDKKFVPFVTTYHVGDNTTDDHTQDVKYSTYFKTVTSGRQNDSIYYRYGIKLGDNAKQDGEISELWEIKQSSSNKMINVNMIKIK